jgi:hypothetical protein
VIVPEGPLRWLTPAGLRRALLATALTALAGPSCALADTSQSANWAGYAVHRSGVSFKRVLGTWRQPEAACAAGQPTYASVWVGLGGYSTSSEALEQIGSEVDCNASGHVVSSAWYELVPAASESIKMTVRPGDELSASVSMTGHEADLQLRDLTRDETFSKRLRATIVDVSSAEWIVEAPSECSGPSSCQTLPLADFGSATFTKASAVTTTGHSGAISSSHWGMTRIVLAPGGRYFIGQDGGTSLASASPSSLGVAGSSFTVTYSGEAGHGPTNSTRSADLRAGSLVRPRLRQAWLRPARPPRFVGISYLGPTAF